MRAVLVIAIGFLPVSVCWAQAAQNRSDLSESLLSIIPILFMILVPSITGLIYRRKGRKFSSGFVMHLIVMLTVAILAAFIAPGIFSNRRLAAGVQSVAILLAVLWPIAFAYRKKSKPSDTEVSEADQGTALLQSQISTPMFLYVSPARLILLSIISMGMYEVYWFYMNWQYVKQRDDLTISPFWRAIFGYFYCHSLLRRIHQDENARAVEPPDFSAGWFATGWVVLAFFASVVSFVPSTAATIFTAFIPSFMCLVPVQNYVNAVTEKCNPAENYYRWSIGHIICLVFGIAVWGGLLLV